MRWKGILAEKPLISKLLVFTGVCLVSMSIFTFLGFAIASLIFQLDLISNPEILSNYTEPGIINALKLVQAFSAVGLFVIPSIITAWLFSFSPSVFLKLNIRPSVQATLIVIFILFACLPVINWLVMLNQQLALPSFLSGVEEWMKNSEEEAEELTKAFLATTSYTGLFANIIIIGLIPAIGEELLFRGVLQKLLTDTLKNKHLAIVISAMLFSALHMQFFGFIPRMLLGVLLGYFLAWSNTLWLPIAGHFINNTSAVIFAFYAARSSMPFDQDTIGTMPGEQYLLLFSIAATTGLLVLLYKLTRKTLTPDSIH